MVTFVLLALRQLSGELADPFGEALAAPWGGGSNGSNGRMVGKCDVVKIMENHGRSAETIWKYDESWGFIDFIGGEARDL